MPNPLSTLMTQDSLRQRITRLLDIMRCMCFWLAVAVAAWWAFDRAPPLRVLSVEPAVATRGQKVEVTMQVARDTGRNCSVGISRYAHDANGFRYELDREIYVSARNLEVLERLNPGVARLAAVLPAIMAPGPATFVTSLSYVCNPLHHLWPLEVVITVPVQVLP